MKKKTHYNEQDYVYMDCKIRMSAKNMANLMYALIITRSPLTNSFGVGIYDYTKKQNSYNMVDIKVFIHPDNIDAFEKESGIKLNKPILISIN